MKKVVVKTQGMCLVRHCSLTDRRDAEIHAGLRKQIYEKYHRFKSGRRV